MSDSEIDPKVISLWLRSIDANYLKSKYASMASMESVAHLHIQAADLIDALAAERDELDATVRLLSKVQTKLIAELAAERKDAERYRWLRDHKPNYFIEFRVEKMIPRGPSSPYWETVSKTRTDSTIDAAMKEQKP